MKRIEEITIIHYRRRRVTKSQTTSARNGPVCECGADLMTESVAVRFIGISHSTLNEWISNNLVVGHHNIVNIFRIWIDEAAITTS